MDGYYQAAEQRVLMFTTFLFIGDVKDREGMVKGLATYIAHIEADRDVRLAALQSLVEQLPQPNLDDPDLDNAIDAANAIIAKARGE
jgi:hypothetical protein